MMKKIEQTLNDVSNNLQSTENGALGYKTAGKALVDINFRVPSMRQKVTRDDVMLFRKAMEENLEYAIKWLFFVRDVRFGLGERNAFVKLFGEFYIQHQEEATKVLDLISEYGRWKDVVDIAFSTTSNNLKDSCFSIIKDQLVKDINSLTRGESVSLLGKWLPSINASKGARVRGRELCEYLGVTFGIYRKMLSRLRSYLDVTEVKTCGNQWEEIDYNKVSSNANLRYSDAFLRHDQERRSQYLKDLLNPEKTGVKMNAGDLYPYEIWSKYTEEYYGSARELNDGYEAMWNNLKDMGTTGNTMCICDGSGSMTISVSGKVKAIDVSRSLSVYFAERCEGEYKNRFIEFSANPHFIDINDCETLFEKINKVAKYHDCSNTNLEKVFDLIRKTAVDNGMKQSDLPERLLVVSDMEFDQACSSNSYYSTLFDVIGEKYKTHGYKLPKLVFWNVNSRTNTIPVQVNELGVILISGFSVNLVKMVMSNQTDPWLCLNEILDSDRYKAIGERLQ